MEIIENNSLKSSPSDRVSEGPKGPSYIGQLMEETQTPHELTSHFDDDGNSFNWLFTITQNDKTRPIEDIFEVLRFINKTRHLKLDRYYNLEVAPKTKCLHVHIRASIPLAHRRILFPRYKYNLPQRLHKRFHGYHFNFVNIKDDYHNSNILGYHKNVSNLEAAIQYVLQGYAEGWFTRCPYHSCGTCNDFSLREALNYYIYSIYEDSFVY